MPCNRALDAVWNRLEAENKEFFAAYNTQLATTVSGRAPGILQLSDLQRLECMGHEQTQLKCSLFTAWS
jgi:hypothetical protein